jgi:hypothetical protein
MSQIVNQFSDILVCFSTSTALALALEWLFGPVHPTTNQHDLWIQFFSGISQFFVYVVAAPQIAAALYPYSVYGAPGMTSSLTFFWGILFQTNMRAKIVDWYQSAVDPALYTNGGNKDASCSTCQ